MNTTTNSGHGYTEGGEVPKEKHSTVFEESMADIESLTISIKKRVSGRDHVYVNKLRDIAAEAVKESSKLFAENQTLRIELQFRDTIITNLKAENETIRGYFPEGDD